MSIEQELKEQFEQLERETVSDSFGGDSFGGRAPAFAFKPIMKQLGTQMARLSPQPADDLKTLKGRMSPRCFKYAMECLGRFAFCIELTNLNITSTKMKTRWVSGSITKTRQGTFENYEGNFTPGEDERSAIFNECYSIFEKCINLLVNSDVHIYLINEFSDGKKRGTPYEAVFTYIDPQANLVHEANNIRLVNTDDAFWLTKARPIIQPVISRNPNDEKTKCAEKISTKCYKTDRSQTGEVQTNRAKRWECLEMDFQHATIEECWSVERKLLSDLAHFEGFPNDARQSLIQLGLFGQQDTTLCPITLEPLIFDELLGGGGHGESKFQVGHMLPLKAEGRHEGDNISWISNDGNRIQGSLNIRETRQMLIGIFERMGELGLLNDIKTA